MRPSRPARRPLALLLLLAVPACIPYTVGSTAHPVREGEVQRAMSLYSIPNGLERLRASDSARASYTGADLEYRWGLDERSDVGVRIPAASGVVLTYKRRLGQEQSRSRPAVAVMPGAGVVNLGQHAHVELTMIASGPETGTFTPYGGLRAMQVIPIAGGAVHDSPTAGGFLGLRIGDSRFSLTPELGVYYDRSALGLRDGKFILVPSVTITRLNVRDILDL